MSTATDDLKAQASTYRKAMIATGNARRVRDIAKRDLKDLEAQIFAAKVLTGHIDGRNAETREAQAQIQYKANADWQGMFDAYWTAELTYQTTLDQMEADLVELKVLAIIVNAEIAQTGSNKLLAEVDLAGV